MKFWYPIVFALVVGALFVACSGLNTNGGITMTPPVSQSCCQDTAPNAMPSIAPDPDDDNTVDEDTPVEFVPSPSPSPTASPTPSAQTNTNCVPC